MFGLYRGIFYSSYIDGVGFSAGNVDLCGGGTMLYESFDAGSELIVDGGCR